MKSIYNSAKEIIEGNYKGTNVPKSNFNRVSIAPSQPTAGEPEVVRPISPFPQVRGTTGSTGGGALSKIKSAFSRAAELEKNLTARPLPNNPPAPPKPAPQEIPSVTSNKTMGISSFTSPAPVVTKGPSGSEKIPADAGVPAYIRQNKPEPELKDMPAPSVFKTNPDREAQQKAKELMDKMDQMQQQGIGQAKPKVSSDYYKNLKALGMKTSNESRMSSAYSVIRRILGEASSDLTPDEQKELDAYHAAKKSGKPISTKATMRAADLISKKDKASKAQAQMDKEDAKQAQSELLRDRESKETRGDRSFSTITPGSVGDRGKVTHVDLTKQNPNDKEADMTRGSQSKYLQDKGLKGNEAMKKQEADAAKKAAPIAIASKPQTAQKAPEAVAPSTTVSREAEKSGPDVEGMKKGIAANQKYDGVDTVAKTKEMADAEKPVEAPTHKPQAAAEPTKNKADDYTSGDHRRFDPNAPLRGEFSRVKDSQDSKPQASETPAEKPAEKPQAAATPSSSEFKFSPEQEKWLGKANRQDPYIINRMPGDKPPVDYYKDPKDQELAKKINTGNETVKKIKGALGMKESTINKKFNITDALYQSVMEVMKKDKKEGSVPRNDKEKELAAAYGDPKRITHGDVLKMRGVTKEEVQSVKEDMYNQGGVYKEIEIEPKRPQDKERSMTRGTRPKTASPGWGKDDYKPLIPDTEKPGSARVSPAGSTTKPDPKGKMKPSSGDPEGVKESKDTPGNGYAHQCAVHVKSESFGEGRTITTQHADPDADGNIAWYDVMFEHGIEKQVPTSELEILVSETHMHMKKKKM